MVASRAAGPARARRNWPRRRPVGRSRPRRPPLSGPPGGAGRGTALAASRDCGGRHCPPCGRLPSRGGNGSGRPIAPPPADGENDRESSDRFHAGRGIRGSCGCDEPGRTASDSARSGEPGPALAAAGGEHLATRAGRVPFAEPKLAGPLDLGGTVGRLHGDCENRGDNPGEEGVSTYIPPRLDTGIAADMLPSNPVLLDPSLCLVRPLTSPFPRIAVSASVRYLCGAGRVAGLHPEGTPGILYPSGTAGRWDSGREHRHSFGRGEPHHKVGLLPGRRAPQPPVDTVAS